MYKYLVILLFPLLVFSQENTNAYEVLSYDDFKNQISKNDVLLFDVRTMEEFNSGHLKGSVNIDFYDEKKNYLKIMILAILILIMLVQINFFRKKLFL